MRHRCLCPCHIASVADRQRDDGVDVRDHIEAVSACESCVGAHAVAIISEWPPATPPQPVARVPWSDEDGG